MLHRTRFDLAVMLPALALLALVSVVPFLSLIWMSLNHIELMGGLSFTFSGLDNWVRMFTDKDVGASWLRTIIYFASTLGCELLLGVAIALYLYARTSSRNILLSLTLVPMFIAPVIVGLLGRFLLDPSYGLYSWLLSSLHIYSGNILGSPGTARIAVALLDVWEWTPLITLIVLAGLTAVPRDILEAADIDGASYLRKLRHIILPSLSGILLVALLIRAMDAIRFFAIIFITTRGGPADATKIIPIKLYNVAFRYFDFGYSAAIGLSMLAFSILIAIAFVHVLGKER